MSETIVGRRSGIRWIPISDIEGCPPNEHGSLESLRMWIESFLTQPNPDLGRTGNVCPFTGPALERGMLWVGCMRGHRADIDALRGIVRDEFDIYPTLPAGRDASTSVLRAIITVLPEDTDYRIIDDVHQEFKSRFVDRGTMLGQFYPGCPQPGLWNKEFRPLSAPLPMLAVRTMVPSDFPFLAERPEWIDAYLRKFGSQLSAHARAAVADHLAAKL
ncbi:hypothetical protein EBN03_20890 [Nocardia stercoris]|uniref:DUF6875 domain-containing protein n=2 Tax=Nocardia stercoris TaxID=2483361 RepID=A0A3M2L1D1_9NOCA|nr:hypothetical protein EBN03_20890 [Nocardia stercoris]